MSSRSRKCCSEMDHAPLYVSDFGFLVGGEREGAFVGLREPVRLKNEDLGLRHGCRRTGRWGSTGTCGRRCHGFSVHRLSMRCRLPCSQLQCRGDVYIPTGVGSAPPLAAEVYAVKVLPFTCMVKALGCQLLPIRRVSESPNEARIGSMIDRFALRTQTSQRKRT